MTAWASVGDRATPTPPRGPRRGSPTSWGACALWGVETVTVRLDKGFFSRSMVRTLDDLDVRFLLKVPAHQWLADHQQPWRRSRKGKHIVPGRELWTTSGRMWGVRLLSLQTRHPLAGDDNTLELDTYEVLMSAHLLTNIEGIHALTAWRRYNRGAVVEQRIKELGQLGAGATAINHLDGNALLWVLGAIAYQLLHTIRTTALSGAWRTAQPNRLRLRLFRLPAKLTRHSRKLYVQLLRDDPRQTPYPARSQTPRLRDSRLHSQPDHSRLALLQAPSLRACSPSVQHPPDCPKTPHRAASFPSVSTPFHANFHSAPSHTPQSHISPRPAGSGIIQSAPASAAGHRHLFLVHCQVNAVSAHLEHMPGR